MRLAQLEKQRPCARKKVMTPRRIRSFGNFNSCVAVIVVSDIKMVTKYAKIQKSGIKGHWCSIYSVSVGLGKGGKACDRSSLSGDDLSFPSIDQIRVNRICN